MPSIDPWPLTPVLAQLPAVARLNRDFEAERLRSDLDATDGRWADIKIMTGAGVGAPITHHHWPAGQLWYADFTRLHAVENRGTTRRIHLVFSVGVSDELLELFPEVFRRPEHRGEFLDDRPAVALGDDVKGLPRSFQLPTA